MGKQQKVKMSDIAERLGVSVVAVSKALSNKEGVSDALRTKIFQTAYEMGYEVKNTALPNMIGILVAEHFVNDYVSYYWYLCKMMIEETQRRGYFSAVASVTSMDEKEMQYPPFVSRDKTVGVIVLGALESEYLIGLKAMNPNLVLVDAYDPNLKVTTIDPDNYADFYRLTSDLIEQGFHDFGFVGNIHLNSSIQDRYLGFCKALLNHKINPASAVIINDRDHYEFRKTFDLPRKLPEVLVCNCDQTARNLIQYLSSIGIRVPEDISVTGYYDYIFATISKPEISSVHVDSKQLAYESVNAILESGNGQFQTNITIPGTLVKRSTVSKKS